MSLLTVGVLALQGAYAKHIARLQAMGYQVKEVRRPEDLSGCDGLIIPGGESSTMMRQIEFIHFAKSLNEYSQSKPIFGTCAGLILMSKKIVSDPMIPFGWMDIEVERNAYGRQAESFTQEVEVHLEKKRKRVPAVFIRAPRIKKTGPHVEILSKVEEEPILVREGFMLGATFHPELSGDTSIHEFFVGMIKKMKGG